MTSPAVNTVLNCDGEYRVSPNRMSFAAASEYCLSLGMDVGVVCSSADASDLWQLSGNKIRWEDL